MSDFKLTYAQLLETNNLIQQNADEIYWLCATRTVQESKIFPVSAYILFSYLNAFYRYPVLLSHRRARRPPLRRYNICLTGAWCKGSTPAFGAVDLGSNPGAPAKCPAHAGLLYLNRLGRVMRVSLF